MRSAELPFAVDITQVSITRGILDLTFSLCWFLGHFKSSLNGQLELKVIAVYHLNEHASAGYEREGPIKNKLTIVYIFFNILFL